MHEFKHTPGPWTRKGDYILNTEGFCLATAEDTCILNDWHLKGVGHWSEKPGITFIDIPEGQHSANAKLIAAAPELLQVISEIFDSLDKLNVHANSEEFRLWKLCNEAIKKATE